MLDAAGAAGNFSLAAGTFDTAVAGNYAVAIDGDWTISGGTFQARNSTIASRGDISITPTTFLLNKQGEIVKQYVGAPNEQELHSLIEKLLAS